MVKNKTAQHSMFRKRILKQSQKNGNQLSALFHGRKTSSPTDLRLWLGVRKAGPVPRPWGGRHRGPRPGTRLEGSAALELQDVMAPGVTSSGNKLSSSRIVLYLQQPLEKGFKEEYAWGTRRQLPTPASSLAQALQHRGEAMGLAMEP